MATVDRTAPLILVRHGKTVADAALSASQWPLQDPDTCRTLGRLLPELPVIASPEPKAVGTALAFGRGFSIDDRLREVERPWTANSSEFEASVADYLHGKPIEGWEPQADAVQRFAAAASGIVVSHGTVISLYLGAVSNTDPIEFWQHLAMPDAWELTTDGDLVWLSDR